MNKITLFTKVILTTSMLIAVQHIQDHIYALEPGQFSVKGGLGLVKSFAEFSLNGQTSAAQSEIPDVEKTESFDDSGNAQNIKYSSRLYKDKDGQQNIKLELISSRDNKSLSGSNQADKFGIAASDFGADKRYENASDPTLILFDGPLQGGDVRATLNEKKDELMPKITQFTQDNNIIPPEKFEHSVQSIADNTRERQAEQDDANSALTNGKSVNIAANDDGPNDETIVSRVVSEYTITRVVDRDEPSADPDNEASMQLAKQEQGRHEQREQANNPAIYQAARVVQDEDPGIKESQVARKNDADQHATKVFNDIAHKAPQKETSPKGQNWVNVEYIYEQDQVAPIFDFGVNYNLDANWQAGLHMNYALIKYKAKSKVISGPGIAKHVFAAPELTHKRLGILGELNYFMDSQAQFVPFIGATLGTNFDKLSSEFALSTVFSANSTEGEVQAHLAYGIQGGLALDMRDIGAALELRLALMHDKMGSLALASNELGAQNWQYNSAPHKRSWNSAWTLSFSKAL